MAKKEIDMFTKMKLLWELFQNGKQVVDKEFWLKQQAVATPVIVSLLLLGVQLAKTFGVDIPLDNETCYMLAGLLYFAVNTVLLFVTNKRLGVPAKAQEAPQAADDQDMLPPSNEPEEAVVEAPSDLDDDSEDDTLRRAREWLKRNSKNGVIEQYDVFQSK